MASKRSPMPIVIRPLAHGDLQAVAVIDKQTPIPWGPSVFYKISTSLKGAVYVAVVGKQKIVGFIAYEFRETKCHILDLVVDKNFQRRKIGTKLLGFVRDLLSSSKVENHVIVDLRETNLGGQLFLKENGFIATQVNRAFYDDTDEDQYRFERYELLELPPDKEPAQGEEAFSD